jgi:hypothetical protein
MAHHPPSDTMTSITPPSFVDDGLSFTRRIPRSGGRWDINKWLEGTSVTSSILSTTDSSAYTGSFVDDGADMLAVDPRKGVPGFGRIDKRFYRKGKREKDEGEWTEDMAKAVGGDIWRSLREVRRLGDAKVVDLAEQKRVGKITKRKDKAVDKVNEHEDGGVWVRLPMVWGAFVIEGHDGRVVIVDRDGEYDSGRPGEVVVDLGRSKSEKEEQRRRKREEKRKREEMASAKRNEESAALHNRPEHKKSWRRRSSKRATKPLTPILETDTPEEGSVVLSNAPSFTNFSATGGASGWPSPVLSPVNPPASPTRSPPGAWPSPVLSPVKQSSEVRWDVELTTHSAPASAVESMDTWKETWEESGLTNKQASVAGSHRSVRAESLYRLPIRFENGREEQKERSWTQDSGGQSARSPTKSIVSPVSSRPGAKGKDSWTRDVEDFYSYVSPATVVSRASSVAKLNLASNEPTTSYSTRSHTSSRFARSRAPSPTGTAIVEQSWDKQTSSHSSPSSQSSTRTSTSHNTASFSAWNVAHTEPNTRSTHSPQESSVGGSQVSTVQPFSWRRDVEEQSTYSTKGSSGSHSDAGSVTGTNTWQEKGEDEENWKQDTDTRSVRSMHSMYHQPTVEDAPPTPAEGSQDWGTTTSNTDWGGTRSDKNAPWNGSQHSSNGSGKSMRDQNGYSEDNQTWLNTEVGGVRFREAEWRRPGAVSWKDV